MQAYFMGKNIIKKHRSLLFLPITHTIIFIKSDIECKLCFICIFLRTLILIITLEISTIV